MKLDKKFKNEWQENFGEKLDISGLEDIAVNQNDGLMKKVEQERSEIEVGV